MTTKEIVTIPFGKYKGQPVEQLQMDQNYREWLLQQPWLAERYANIKTIIINNFKEADETPEHNLFQAECLDRNFLFNLANTVKKYKYEQFLIDKQKIENGDTNTSINGNCTLQIEHEGWDLCAHLSCCVNDNWHKDPTWDIFMALELKPTLANEYPAVLRQIKSRSLRKAYKIGREIRYEPVSYQSNGKILLIKEYNGITVPYETVKKIFKNENILLLKISEIECLHAPDWLKENQ